MAEPNNTTEAQQRWQDMLREIELEPTAGPEKRDDFDQMIEYLWGKNGVANQRKDERIFQERLKEAQDLSTDKEPIPYKVKPKEKEKGIGKKAILWILASVFVLQLSISAYQAKTKAELKETVMSEISLSAKQNKKYGNYNPNEKEPYWWFESREMATDVLNNYQQYDLDTRIYGCYKGLYEYKKEDYMNELFYYMNKIVYANPENYTQDVLDICKNTTFKEYLKDKNLSLQEWLEQMEKIVIEYGKLGKESDKLDQLLEDLNYYSDEFGGSGR